MPGGNIESYVIGVTLFHNTGFSNIYLMYIIFKIALKATQVCCFLDSVSAALMPELGVHFLPKLVVSTPHRVTESLLCELTSFLMLFPFP